MTNAGENLRLSIVKSCQIFFIMILAEGVLRKWLLNPIEKPLVLVRDPILIFIYIQYILYVLKGRGNPTWFWPFATLLAVFLFAIILQNTYLSLNPVIYVFGIRNYLGFIPLSFIMADVFDRDAVNRTLRLILYLSIPIAILVVLQFKAPLDSIINKSTDDSIESIFTVAEGVVRPYGPFTFVIGQSLFSVMALSVFLIATEQRKELGLSLPMLAICGFSVASMGAVAGSRTYFVSAAIVVAFYILSGLTANLVAGFRRILLAVGAVVMLVLVMTVVFPEAAETMLQRQQNATESEGATSDRAANIVTEVFTNIDDKLPLFGNGIGFGTNIGGFAATGASSFTLAEYEWTRIVLECGPILGLLVVLFRIALTFIIGALALRANIRSKSPTPLLFFGYLAPVTLMSQISGQNTLLSFAWFSLGLQLAMIRTSGEGAPATRASKVEIAPHSLVPRRSF